MNSGRLALVTGGGGFLGNSIARQLLAAGWSVRVLGRKARPELESAGAQVLRGDIAEEDRVIKACIGVEAVFHAAALTGIWGDRGRFHFTNVLGTHNVIAACRRQGVPRLIYTSSPSVVFSGNDHVMGDETLPYPDSHLCHYSRSKSLAERAVLAANDPPHLATVALRPHLVWGPGDPHLVPRIVARARAGRLVRVGYGNNRVDLTYIENAAQAHLAAEQALRAGRAAGKAYFVTNGEPVELWGWIADLLGRLKIPAPRLTVPASMAYLLGGGLETLWNLLLLPGEPPMTRFLARELSTTHTYNISAARRDLGYEPKISMAQGLENLLAHLEVSSRREQ